MNRLSPEAIRATEVVEEMLGSALVGAYLSGTAVVGGLHLITGKWREEQELVGELYDAAWPQFLRQAVVPIPEKVRQFGEGIVGKRSTNAIERSAVRFCLGGGT
jgi:hypothetical protein